MQVDEGFATRPAPHGNRLAYEERVVAHLVLEGEPALDPAERAFDQWRAELAGRRLDPRPVRDRGHAAGEVLRQVLLARGEDADRERAGLAEQLVERRVSSERDPDQRRVQPTERRTSRP